MQVRSRHLHHPHSPHPLSARALLTDPLAHVLNAAICTILNSPHTTQMADFFHRVEVRDLTGHCNSVLFSPDQHLDYGQLRRGATVFVRYAAKAYFSDLMTQVNMVHRSGTMEQ
jgi:hypothetical protein